MRVSTLFFLDFPGQALHNKDRMLEGRARYMRIKKKQGILIGIIAVAVLAVAGIIFLIAGMGQEKQDSQIRKYRSLGKIEYIKYTIGGEEEVLIKKDNTWKWKSHPELEVDQEYMATQANSISSLLQMYKIEEKGKLKSFGLDDSEINLTVKDNRGKKISISLGDMHTEDLYYAQIGNSKNIYVISSEVMSIIDNLSAQKDVGQEPDREIYKMEEEK